MNYKAAIGILIKKIKFISLEENIEQIHGNFQEEKLKKMKLQ
jgi:hypothetical protein